MISHQVCQYILYHYLSQYSHHDCDIEHMIKILNATNYQLIWHRAQWTDTTKVGNEANQSNASQILHFDDEIYRTHLVCVNVGILSSMFRLICHRSMHIFWKPL